MLFEDTARHRRTGIALLTIGTLCFATLDACAKWLVRGLPVVEVVWLRFALHVLLGLAVMAPTLRRELPKVTRPDLQLLRAALLAAMTGLNFWALQYLQLAVTGAIQFSVPLLIALMSALWLGERLDARRWAAIVAGFAGVLLVVRPGTQAFHPAIGLSLVQTTLYAAFNLLTRRMAATEPPAVTQLLSAAGAAVALAPFALAHWRSPEGAVTWGIVVACGTAGLVGHWAVAAAHRYASAAVLGPFLYQQILYMVAWGWLLFGQVPDAPVFAGAAVVIASGLYLLWREARAVRPTS